MKRILIVIVVVLVLVSGGWDPAISGTFSLRDIQDVSVNSQAQARPFEQLENWNQGAFGTASGESSMKRAVLYSLLLPGLGEYYTGHTVRARAFFAIEAAVWTSFIVLRTQGHLREDRYKEFAVQFAGISGTDHSDDFYKTVGVHGSSNDYEAEFKSESRPEIWPDVGYDALEKYYLENRISDFEEWAWASFDRRIQYREMRSSSRLAYRRSLYMLAAAAANRVASAVSAYQTVKSAKKETGEQTGRYFLDFGSPGHDTRGEYEAAITLIRTF
jgi:hypothetical protein